MNAQEKLIVKELLNSTTCLFKNNTLTEIPKDKGELLNQLKKMPSNQTDITKALIQKIYELKDNVWQSFRDKTREKYGFRTPKKEKHYDDDDDYYDDEYEFSKVPEQVKRKNNQLIYQLKTNRTKFAGIGTNKAKRRLNKLAINSILAKAVRLALEIEDKNISAKNSYGKYRNKIYNQKTELILELCKIFKEQNWIYGTQKSEVPAATKVIYFEIPECEQISWHFSPTIGKYIPIYEKEWDKKENSTLSKLEVITKQLLITLNTNLKIKKQRKSL